MPLSDKNNSTQLFTPELDQAMRKLYRPPTDEKPMSSTLERQLAQAFEELEAALGDRISLPEVQKALTELRAYTERKTKK